MFIWCLNSAHALSVLDSQHNLSASSSATIRATTENDVCVFCHTVHGGSPKIPLWNHGSSGATYTPYSSTTTKATIGQPTGASKLCLSCHDGTVALGLVHNRASPMQMRDTVTTLPAGKSNLGIDLSDDHPVSFTYDAALAAANGQLKDPSTLTDKVRLDKDHQMQCTSCHDAHDNQFGKFLVQKNDGSALCNNCHSVNSWQQSSHNNSPALWNGQGENPWPRTEQTTVAGNGCENCHAPHNAGTKPRLLNSASEEQNCYACHNGNVATKNIQTEFSKISVHPIENTSGVHDPTEDPINPTTRHVECADCHNSHAAKSQMALAPNAAGALAGAKGIDSSGNVIQPLVREYELCFRCHGDSIARGPARVTRQVIETNKRLQFSVANASFHPVETVGKNPNVPSLIAPLTAASLIYCTDCHNNDQGPGAGGAGPKGPHGSSYAPLLEREQVLADFSPESAASYALCYKCHSRSSILSDQSFPTHSRHIINDQTACTTCHDSHGVATASRLINFNTTYVTPSSRGILQFNSTGNSHGTCALTCHGHDHDNTTY